ncbi:uncharacterized protein LOC116293237 [Actinia tenebrosa]|uniref:Uncharacterized protein LOC116293237 n=1 Tax=Actinia tenebrosa TaxID=6105 RepID=A0A6P8HUZ7_ACTTE|nr:uncharacterized protein LOC116293237 [Actinia tenebrosa]
MSFLHNLYRKVIPDGSSRRTNSSVNCNDNTETPVFEDFDSEDGFVVYTEKTSTAANRQTYGVQERIEYNTLQTNATQGSYNPSGLSGLSSPCSSKTNMILTSRGVKEHRSSTFLTVSDIPLRLCKHLEMIQNSTKGLTYHSSPPIHIEDYLYDFGLERTVINTAYDGGNTRGKR